MREKGEGEGERVGERERRGSRMIGRRIRERDRQTERPRGGEGEEESMGWGRRKGGERVGLSHAPPRWSCPPPPPIPYPGHVITCILKTLSFPYRCCHAESYVGSLDMLGIRVPVLLFFALYFACWLCWVVDMLESEAPCCFFAHMLRGGWWSLDWTRLVWILRVMLGGGYVGIKAPCCFCSYVVKGYVGVDVE